MLFLSEVLVKLRMGLGTLVVPWGCCRDLVSCWVLISSSSSSRSVN